MVMHKVGAVRKRVVLQNLRSNIIYKFCVGCSVTKFLRAYRTRTRGNSQIRVCPFSIDKSFDDLLDRDEGFMAGFPGFALCANESRLRMIGRQSTDVLGCWGKWRWQSERCLVRDFKPL